MRADTAAAYYLDRVNPMASPVSLEELAAYEQSMGTAVCQRAIDIALDERKATWSYIRAILRDKLSHKVRCLADWDRLEEKREEEKTHGNGTASGSSAAAASDGSFRGWRARSVLDDAD